MTVSSVLQKVVLWNTDTRAQTSKAIVFHGVHFSHRKEAKGWEGRGKSLNQGSWFVSSFDDARQLSHAPHFSKLAGLLEACKNYILSRIPVSRTISEGYQKNFCALLSNDIFCSSATENSLVCSALPGKETCLLSVLCGNRYRQFFGNNLWSNEEWRMTPIPWDLFVSDMFQIDSASCWGPISCSFSPGIISEFALIVWTFLVCVVIYVFLFCLVWQRIGPTRDLKSKEHLQMLVGSFLQPTVNCCPTCDTCWALTIPLVMHSTMPLPVAFTFESELGFWLY